MHANALHDARTRERFTLRQLAARTGIPHPRLWALEHGHGSPSPIERRLLRAALGLALDAWPDSDVAAEPVADSAGRIAVSAPR